MRIIFMGTPDFAVPVLQSLINSRHEVVAVVTQPDTNGDGVTKKVGCDGEIVRSISPDDTYIVKITVLQTSDTNSFLQERFAEDRQTGDGMFPILIKDLKGGMVFSTDAAWPIKPASRGFGKESTNREWELHTGSGNLTE